MAQQQQANKPEYEVGERVNKRSEAQGGRVQSVAYDSQAKSFRYDVKWDLGPTTRHLEAELAHAPLPPHYP